MSVAPVSKPRRDDRGWYCTAHLPAWHDLLEAGDGDRIKCEFLPDGSKPGAALIATVRRVVENQETLRDAVTAAIRRYYDAKREKYVAFARLNPDFMGDPDVSMPENPDRATFAALHELQCLFVHSVLRDGLAYVGFSFAAQWDPEHGVGVMTHGVRIVGVGGEDTAFLEWIAEKDRRAAVT